MPVSPLYVGISLRRCLFRLVNNCLMFCRSPKVMLCGGYRQVCASFASRPGRSAYRAGRSQLYVHARCCSSGVDVAHWLHSFLHSIAFDRRDLHSFLLRRWFRDHVLIAFTDISFVGQIIPCARRASRGSGARVPGARVKTPHNLHFLPPFPIRPTAMRHTARTQRRCLMEEPWIGAL